MSIHTLISPDMVEFIWDYGPLVFLAVALGVLLGLLKDHPGLIFAAIVLDVLTGALATSVHRSFARQKSKAQSQPSAHNRMGQPMVQHSSRLLSLPAELRLQIWRYAVPSTIRLNNEHPLPEVPSIGLACRQTLCETLPIFLRESVYIWTFDGGDGSCMRDALFRIDVLMDFVHVSSKSIVPPNFRVAIGGTLRWESLMRWTKAVHTCPEYPISFREGRSEEWTIIVKTLFIAEELRPLPWDDAKEVLEALPAAKDPRWA